MREEGDPLGGETGGAWRWRWYGDGDEVVVSWWCVVGGWG